MMIKGKRETLTKMKHGKAKQDEEVEREREMSLRC